MSIKNFAQFALKPTLDGPAARLIKGIRIIVIDRTQGLENRSQVLLTLNRLFLPLLVLSTKPIGGLMHVLALLF